MGDQIGIQAIGLMGTVLFFLSYQCQRNRDLFRVQFLSYLFYTTHLILLGALTGGVSYILNGVRSFCLGSKMEFARSRKMCGILCALQLLTLLFTWSGWLSCLPVAANIAATVGGYTHNARKIRMVNLCVNSPLWILYDVMVGSWAGVLDELVSDGSVLLSILRYGWAGLEKIGE